MKVKICTWKECKSRFSEYILKRLKNDKEFYDFKNLEIEECTCLWECKKWPNILVDGKKEEHMSPAKTSEIIVKKLKK